MRCKAIAPAAAFLLAAASPPAVPPAGEEPTFSLADRIAFEPATTDSISIGTDRSERMTVPVTIGGQPFRFLIDTGSQATVVSSRLRERLALPSLGRSTVIGMASSRQVEIVRLDALELATRSFDNLHVPMLEAEHIGADGILGLDSLQDLRVLIDFRADTIAVDDAQQLGGDRGYEIVVRAKNKRGRLIITGAEVDGVATTVILDTGAQGSIGNLALQRRLRAQDGMVVTSTDVLGAQVTSRRDLPRTLVIDGKVRSLRLQGFAMSFTDSPVFTALGLADKPTLVLGISDLRLFDRVAIDFAERTILFDLPRGTQERPPIEMRDGIKRL